MNNGYCQIFRSILVLAAVLTGIPLAAQETGEEWEYQGSMEMMGMQMPMPVTTYCQSAEQEEMTPPVEGNCDVTNVDTEGNTTSFRIECGPPNPMEGSGTTTRTEDRLESSYTMTSEEGEMRFTMTGRRLGNCELQ